MNKVMILLVGGVSLIIIGALIWQQSFATASLSSQPVASVIEQNDVRRVAKTLVTRRAIQAGSVLKVEDLGWQELPHDYEHHIAGLFLDGFVRLDDLKGSLITRNLVAGQVLSSDDLVRPEQGHYLSSMMAPGMRAVTLNMPQDAVSYGLIRPGNRVDIILTTGVSVQEGAAKADPNLSAEVVLTDIKMLAIDSRLSDFDSLQSKGSDEELIETVNVTFELQPKQAAQLLLAKKLGSISLVLRASRDSNPQVAFTQQGERLIWAKDVTFNPQYAKPKQGAPRVNLVYGNTDKPNK